MLDIPDEFSRGIVDREGPTAKEWLTSLPGIVAELLQRWSCTPAAPLTHGQVGVILPVHRADGLPAVVKVSFPHPGNVHEPDAFAAWAGRGAVRMYERDDARFAMLLERGGPETLADLDDVEEALVAAGRLVRRLAVPAPPGVPLRRLSDEATEWEENLRKGAEQLGHPLPRFVLDAALATFRELGHDQPDTLVHGDLHYRNVLRGEREPWLAIDPKGMVGDPAFDGINILGSGLLDVWGSDDLRSPLLYRLAIFADAAEIDRGRAQRWLQAQAVTSAHHALEHGEQGWIAQAATEIATVLT